MALANRAPPNLQQLITRGEQLVQPAREEPSWLPCTMFNWQMEGTTQVMPARRGHPIDYHYWTLKKNAGTGDDWVTMISDRPLTQGVHYWEIKFINYGTHFMFGLAFPPQGSADLSLGVSTTGLWRHIGHSGSKILNEYSVGWYNNGTTVKRYSEVNHRGNDIGIPANFQDCRLGFLLDLVKQQFKLYYYAANNATQTPDKEILLVTSLMKGRPYYPAFSFYHDYTHAELTIDADLPQSVVEYKQQIDQLLITIDQLEQQLQVLRELALNEREQHLDNYRRLVQVIANLRRQANIH